MASYFHFRDGRSEAQNSERRTQGDVGRSWCWSRDTLTPSPAPFLPPQNTVCEAEGPPLLIQLDGDKAISLSYQGVLFNEIEESALRQGPRRQHGRAWRGRHPCAVSGHSNLSPGSLLPVSCLVPRKSCLHQQPLLCSSPLFFPSQDGVLLKSTFPAPSAPLRMDKLI